MSNFELTLGLFLQLAVILGACRAVGWLGRRLGQTPVVCEMIAGVLLGPSLLGLIAPAAHAWLFPAASMPVLYALAQVGLVLYMFLVGLEFDSGLIPGRLRGAGLVSGAGIVVPFALGCVAAATLSGRAGLFRPGVPAGVAAVYLGACMSITAFPVLARIIREKGIGGTALGTMALAAGALDDAIAWCLLAVVLAMIQHSVWIAALAAGGGLIFTIGMLVAGRPAFRCFARWTDRDDGVGAGALMTLMLVLMLAAWVTDLIGIYAVFGAFVTGVCMPRGRFARETRARLEPITTTLLLPVFFVYSGLNTRIGLLDSPGLWALAAAIVALAVAGKGVACALAARAGGEAWRDSLAIGTLMNARGLMELIILNIGLQEDLITPTLFTIMVMMAAITTLMTSPLFDAVHGRQPARAPARASTGFAGSAE